MAASDSDPSQMWISAGLHNSAFDVTNSWILLERALSLPYTTVEHWGAILWNCDTRAVEELNPKLKEKKKQFLKIPSLVMLRG